MGLLSWIGRREEFGLHRHILYAGGHEALEERSQTTTRRLHECQFGSNRVGRARIRKKGIGSTENTGGQLDRRRWLPTRSGVFRTLLVWLVFCSCLAPTGYVNPSCRSLNLTGDTACVLGTEHSLRGTYVFEESRPLFFFGSCLPPGKTSRQDACGAS
eukprot:1181362-Prorocentrum_minimum.AAC.2